MIMTRPVWNQLFKELTMLYSKSGGMLVPVRYLNLTCQLDSNLSQGFNVSHGFVLVYVLLYPTGGSRD